MTMPKGWTPDKIRKDARNYSTIAEARKWAEEQQEQQQQKQQQQEEEYDYHTERNRLGKELSSMPSIQEELRIKRKKAKDKSDALTALGITAIIATIALFIIGLVNLNYWYLMIPGFIGLFLMFALSGGGGHHEGAAHYWRSSRGRTFRMWAANRRNR